MTEVAVSVSRNVLTYVDLKDSQLVFDSTENALPGLLRRQSSPNN